MSRPGLLASFKKQTRARQMMLVLLLVLLPFFVYGAVYFYRVTRPASLFEDPSKKFGNAPVNGHRDTKNNPGKNMVNVVLLGFDEGLGRSAAASVFRPDTIKVVSVNFDDEKVSIIDIPRDSYTRIADTQTFDKINHSYYYGYRYGKGEDKHQNGIDYALRSVSNILGGIPLHYYVSIDMDAVVTLVDSIGGVEFEVLFDVYDLQGQLQVEKGKQLLTGDKYLWYMRTRNVGGDVGRVQRQTDLLLATLEHLRKEGLIRNIPTIYNTYQEMFGTNLTNQQVIALGLFAGRLDRNKLHTYTLSGGGQSRNGVYYMILESDLIAEVMQDVFGIAYTPPAADTLTDTVPAAPKAFRADVAERGGRAVVSLSWQKGDQHNAAFQIYRSENGQEEVLLARINSLTYQDTAVKAGAAYHYRLEAVNHRAVSGSVQASAVVPANSGSQQPGETLPTDPPEPAEPTEPVSPEPYSPPPEADESKPQDNAAPAEMPAT